MNSLQRLILSVSAAAVIVFIGVAVIFKTKLQSQAAEHQKELNRKEEDLGKTARALQSKTQGYEAASAVVGRN
ncbi:MAG: hypothetical protein ACI8UO_005036 [Verrucomicrobiales bacterium]|jgi:membrane protein implicated in regulation of membrane protease activity